ARAAAALAHADRGLGAAAAVRRRPGAGPVRAVGAHAHVRADRLGCGRDLRPRPLRAPARRARPPRACAVRAARPRSHLRVPRAGGGGGAGMTALLWLTRDLRVHDHPALRAALDRCGQIVPVFCFDDRLLRGRHASGPRTQFMLESLADLDERLGGTLVFLHGAPERELTTLASEARATELHFSADSGPFARRRIRRLTAAMRRTEVESFAHPGLHAVDDLDRIRTQ